MTLLTNRQRNARYKGLESIMRTRIENIRRVINHYGSSAALAKELSVSVAFISQLAGENPTRRPTETLMRRWERTLNLKQGWFDQSR